MASPVVQLPDDVVYCNILPRLPVRTLARLTAVCKAWRLTICRDDSFAALQAQTQSLATFAIARCDWGSLRILSPDSTDAVPRDRYLSFVQVQHSDLFFCASAGGVVCLMEHPESYHARHHEQRWLPGDLPEWRYVRNFFLVNPNRFRTTHRIRRVPYEGDVVTAALAYDPAETAPRDRFFQLVVPVVADDGGRRCRFKRFTSRHPAGWTVSREAFALPPLEDFKQKPAYAGGRVHWLAGEVIVWYDLEDDRAGTTPLPTVGDKGDGRECDGNHHDLGVWRGLLRLARVNVHGVWVWELANAGGARAGRWELVHSRPWEGIPGLICPGTVVMEAGGEKAVSVVVRVTEREGEDSTKKTSSSRRSLLRYDVRTGPALVPLEVRVHEDIGTLVDYHSTMEKLPDIAWDHRKNPRIGRKYFWGA